MDDLQSLSAQQGDVAKAEIMDPASEDEEEETTKIINRRDGYVAFDKHLTDVEITPDETNPVKMKSSTPCTRLKAIGEHLVHQLKIDDLRMFCSRNQIQGGRKATKEQLCRAIARAKVKFDDGLPIPYHDCFHENDRSVMPALPLAPLTSHDIAMYDVHTGSDRKRSRDDYEEASEMNETPLRISITDRANQAKLVALQSRIVQSIEVKNMAIHIKETIGSASAVRHEIHFERARRDKLWDSLVEKVGDEGVASSKYFTFRKARQETEDGVELDDEDFVKRSQEALLADIFEADSLIQQLKRQHAKLQETISNLV